MYTIFFTINCVKQLTFSTTFAEHLIFEQLIFFRQKVKLLKIHVRQMIFHYFWFSSNWQEKILLLEQCRAIIKSCRADFSSNRISSRWSWPDNCFEHYFNIFYLLDKIYFFPQVVNSTLTSDPRNHQDYIPSAQYIHTLTPLTNLQVMGDFGDIMARWEFHFGKKCFSFSTHLYN